jgi:uncharacterized SAM-binding protein YcdF (DUF218 family)
MLYLHKILPLLFLPISVVGYLMIWGLIQKKRTPVLLALVLLWTLSTYKCSDWLVKVLEQGAVRVNPQERVGSEYVVILSGMIHSVQGEHGAVTEWSDPDRFFAGVELFQIVNASRAHVTMPPSPEAHYLGPESTGKVKPPPRQEPRPAHLIFTGGAIPWWPQTPLEGPYLKEKAVAMGVPADLIWVTRSVSTTQEESVAVRDLIQSQHPEWDQSTPVRVTLVTSAFHMPRARALFEDAGFVVDPYPVDFKVRLQDATPQDWIPDAQALKYSQLAFREWMGQAFYGLARLKARLQKP